MAGDKFPVLIAEKTLSLIEGRRREVQPEVASGIQGFLYQRHPTLTPEERDTLGVAVSECLENIRVHAYQGEDERRRGWFVVGQFDEDTATSSVVILDMGIGIVRSVREKVPALARLFRSSADILEEVTAGRLTSSGASHHGKGFRFLREFACANDNRRLHVLSSSSMITWGKDGILYKSGTSDFIGTIVCLQISDGAAV